MIISSSSDGIYRSVACLSTVSVFLFIFWSTLVRTPSIAFIEVDPSPTSTVQDAPQVSSLPLTHSQAAINPTGSASCTDQGFQPAPTPPSAYRQGAETSHDCARRLGTPFLQDASRTAVNYCSSSSPSSLTCFRTQIKSGRIDSFCIGTPATFDQSNMTFKLGCEMSDLTEQQVAAGVPAIAEFPFYQSETGPRIILDRHVRLDAGSSVRSRSKIRKNFSILVRREAAVDHIFHHLMQIFSAYLTLDILQMAFDPATRKPFFRPEDVDNTRVVILDDHPEGPFFDQWKAFATRPMARIQDIQSNVTPVQENIIIPLPGSASIFWEPDCVPSHCQESAMLKVFSQRMLDFYGINEGPEDPDSPLVLTFIDRTEERSLVNKREYLSSLQFFYPDVEIDLVDLATLPFEEQLRTIRRTDILAGVHGAGLTHGIFLPHSSAMVEILPPEYKHEGFRNLARFLGHQYFTTHSMNHPKYTRPNGWQTDDIIIEKDRFIDLMGTAIKSMRHRRLRNDVT